MFFELATADVVVAEISALNPNVFYELGVRNGLCPRGIFLVRGDWDWSRPFDIAPDRSFTYKGQYFVHGKGQPVPEGDVNQLAKMLRQSMKLDPQTIGSPVYSHLSGLKPPDIGGIRTSRAHYFTALHDDWMERVRKAQYNIRPGHIVTLAEEAPTSVHRVKILYEAAKALIGVCCYDAARHVLEQMLSLEPGDVDARIQLGLVLERCGLATQAEDQINGVLNEHKDDPNATDILGQVYRHLWRLSWCSTPLSSIEIRRRAKETYSLAVLAFEYFWRAQQTYPGAYFSGFNAVLLLAIVDNLFGRERPADFGSVQTKELIPTVKFAADWARNRAALSGDHEEHFWSTTTLAGLALIEGDSSRPIQLIRDACAFPQTSLFQKETLKHRLMLLRELDFHGKFAQEAIEIVENSGVMRSKFQFGKVVLFYGGGLQSEENVSPQAPQQGFETLRATINGALDRCGIGKGDLGMTGGIRVPDLLFVELCRKRGATVRILLLEPSPGEISGGLWPPGPLDWATKFQTLAEDQMVSIWSHEEEIGTPLNLQDANSRHNRWLMNTARLTAEGAKERKFFGIVMSNDNKVPEDTDDASYYEHPAFFITTIRRSLNYSGRVEVIRPTMLGHRE
jgi:hypothetical protein